jgi:hypothetical protein
MGEPKHRLRGDDDDVDDDDDDDDDDCRRAFVFFSTHLFSLLLLYFLHFHPYRRTSSRPRHRSSSSRPTLATR